MTAAQLYPGRETNTFDLSIALDLAGLSVSIMSGFHTFWSFETCYKPFLKACGFSPTARIFILNVSVAVDFPALNARQHFFENIDRWLYSVV